MAVKWLRNVVDKWFNRGDHAEPNDEPEIGVVTLITGKDMNSNAQYAYAFIPARNYHDFSLAVEKGGSYKVSDFGYVLCHGNGAEPPERVKQEMKDKYAASDQFEKELEEYAKQFGTNPLLTILSNTRPDVPVPHLDWPQAWETFL